MGKAFKVRLKAYLNCDRFHSDLLAIYVRLQQDVSMTTNTGGIMKMTAKQKAEFDHLPEYAQVIYCEAQNCGACHDDAMDAVVSMLDTQ